MHICQILGSKSPEIVSVTPDQRWSSIAAVSTGISASSSSAVRQENAWARSRSGTAAMPWRVRHRSTADAGGRNHEPHCRDCSTEDFLPFVMSIMTERRTRHVLVMDGNDAVGVVSIGDVVKHPLEEALQAERDMHDYICGSQLSLTKRLRRLPLS